MKKRQKNIRKSRSAIKGTTLSKELERQKRWRLRPQFSKFEIFNKLVKNEFLSEEEHKSKNCQALSEIVNFAEQQIPYYQNLFKKLNISASDIKDSSSLPLLPPLTKLDIHDHSSSLEAKALPAGHSIYGFSQSSGTTGKPTRITITKQCNDAFSYLKQREFRWFHLNPIGSLGTIRLPSQLPRTQDGQELEMGSTLKLPSWPYVGKYFHTGPFFGYSVFNAIDKLADWFFAWNPDYLMTYSETIEHLAFAFQGRKKPLSTKGVLVISEQLTPHMRRNITKTFEVPIFQNYGLNEVGIVASKCLEGSRYHVHTEHCLVEICDKYGKPCAPGETGKILVTGLTNFAMPLLRYDTDDLATVVEGPCSCGRTLPSFGEVIGRYSRIAFLPENTLGYVGAIRDALEKMPAGLSENLRQFQVHQFKDNSFELRLLAPGGLPEEFSRRIRISWEKAVSDAKLPLHILEVEEILRSPGGKFQDFTSDFYPKAG
jgi:phenylacetate-CoA ligase